MIDSIISELNIRMNYLSKKVIKTIYFGGGTPSLLNKNEQIALLNTIKQNNEIDKNIEITLEANPDDVTPENLLAWKENGINRLSIGIQSFRQSDLTWMNRAHNVKEAENCIQLAQKFGFNKLTVDLIYGLPNLSMSEWKQHIQKLLDLNINHISAYCLTVEERTALHSQVKKGKIVMPNEDVQSEQFLALIETLKQNGIQQYEISNFAKPGFESIHNSNYWKGEWYLGVGPSAHSFNGVSRSWNIANNQEYIKGIKISQPIFEVEELTKENQFNELLLTGLRTVYGVSLERIDAIRTLSDGFKNNMEEFKRKGWMIEENNSIFLTEEGRLKADYIASELFI